MLFHLLDSTELGEGRAAGLGWRHAGVDPRLNLVIQIGLQLIVQRAFPRS